MGSGERSRTGGRSPEGTSYRAAALLKPSGGGPKIPQGKKGESRSAPQEVASNLKKKSDRMRVFSSSGLE